MAPAMELFSAFPSAAELYELLLNTGKSRRCRVNPGADGVRVKELLRRNGPHGKRRPPPLTFPMHPRVAISAVLDEAMATAHTRGWNHRCRPGDLLFGCFCG